MQITNGWLEANKIVVGIALVAIVAATVFYLLRRWRR